MNLHRNDKEFKELISLVAEDLKLPESAIERDYYIVLILKNLENSEYAEQCVFKGGTSLSKCYPGSIERFSEDIDLTFLGMDESDKFCDKTIKRIEAVMTVGANIEKIDRERSDRSKSMYVWFDDVENRIKLEIGSNVKPDPYTKKTFKSYIHEYLENFGHFEDVEKYELESVTLNVLNIERTFIDKIMSVKRHAFCGSLKGKVRHIYDVTKLFSLPQIQEFLLDKEELKRLLITTKNTDSYYLNKRRIDIEYDPSSEYGFEEWKSNLDEDIKNIYENLHKTLLFTDEKQNFDEAINVFTEINKILKEIGE